jgi:hypothetical protein
MKYLLCLLLICIIGGTFGDFSHASICEQPETIVYFGNGINTIRKQALDNSEVIEKRLIASLPEPEYQLLQFDVAYNDTGGIFIDLLEASIQDLQTDYSRFWRILGGIEIMPDWFAVIMNEIAASVDKVALVTTDSLADQVNDYKTKINEGKKILLVAHSQGNFFANQAYGILNSTAKPSFGIVSVANPDSFVADEGSHTTLEEDDVIEYVKWVRILAGLSAPMTPNLTNSPIELPDERGHSFINAYMIEGSNSDQKITSDMTSVLGSLVAPRQIVEPGVITVSLTWGAEPDMDLHVYEPNGSHVFWYTPEGFSGFLDKDDVNSWGPEHYTVDTCDTLETGSYRVALDYYEGNNPEVAIVQVEAGLKVRVFKVSMPSEAYGDPIYPVHLTSIRVFEADNGGYDLQIY